MGNSASSGRPQDDTVEYGALVPQGIYTGPRDWNQQVVGQAIVDRRLAPFYRPLEDYEEDFTDEQILANRKEPPPPPPLEEGEGGGGPSGHREGHGGSVHVPQPSTTSSRIHGKKASTSGKGKEQATLNEASLYRGAAECPICFLYYPPNINYARCCGQTICTECFVQIKRAEPDAQHLESEPAACPYCVQSDFGVVYKPPTWRAGIGSDGHPSSPGASSPLAPKREEHRRRQSFGVNDPQVVTTDQIRPDWQAKVDAVKAAVARRAARRIIMRQVGDRLIPVGISSGRVQIMPEEGQAQAQGSAQGGDDGSRRQRRRDRDISRLLGIPNFSSNNYPGGMIAANDLEELMMAEAMRQSVIDEETRARKEKEEEAKKAKKAGKDKDKGKDKKGALSPGLGVGLSSPGAGSSGAGVTEPPTVSSSAPQSELHLPAITGSSLLPPTTTTTSPVDERGRSGHRAFSSLSGPGSKEPSGTLTPTGTSSASATGSGSMLSPGSGTGSNSGSLRARSQPPFSAISAALRGAASAATAIGAPGKRKQEASTSGSAGGSGTSTPAAGASAASARTPSAPSTPLAQPPAAVPASIPTQVAESTSSAGDITQTPARSPSPPSATRPHVTSAVASSEADDGEGIVIPSPIHATQLPDMVFAPEVSATKTDTNTDPDTATTTTTTTAPLTSTALAGLSVPRPIPQHQDSTASFASSIMSDATDATADPYDVLSSSPEDSDVDEPLLRGEAPLPTSMSIAVLPTPGGEMPPETPAIEYGLGARMLGG